MNDCDEYVIDVCEALLYWLGGKRAGIQLAEGQSMFGKPRLEVLAYEDDGNGNRYCNR